MILSLVDMIREPFELPNWSFKLVVVLLSIGLIKLTVLSISLKMKVEKLHPEALPFLWVPVSVYPGKKIQPSIGLKRPTEPVK